MHFDNLWHWSGVFKIIVEMPEKSQCDRMVIRSLGCTRGQAWQLYTVYTCFEGHFPKLTLRLLGGSLRSYHIPFHGYHYLWSKPHRGPSSPAIFPQVSTQVEWRWSVRLPTYSDDHARKALKRSQSPVSRNQASWRPTMVKYFLGENKGWRLGWFPWQKEERCFIRGTVSGQEFMIDNSEKFAFQLQRFFPFIESWSRMRPCGFLGVKGKICRVFAIGTWFLHGSHYESPELFQKQRGHVVFSPNTPGRNWIITHHAPIMWNWMNGMKISSGSSRGLEWNDLELVVLSKLPNHGTMGRDLVLHMNSSASEVLLHRLSWLHGDAHTATPPCFMRVVVEKAVLGGAMEKATLIYFIWDLWVSYFDMMYICTAVLRLNYRNGFTGIYPNPSCSAISG